VTCIQQVYSDVYTTYILLSTTTHKILCFCYAPTSFTDTHQLDKMLVRSDGKVFVPPVVRSSCKKRCKRTKRVPPLGRKVPIPIVLQEVYYEVEKLVKTRNGEFGKEYFVKWTGYPVSENSWIGELPPFFDKNSHLYKKFDFQQDSCKGYNSSSDYDDSLEDSDFEIDIDESGSDDDAEESGSDDDAEESVCESDFEENFEVMAPIAKRKSVEKPINKQDQDSDKRSMKERLVVKALLALSAVVAGGFADDDESDIDE
jgi:hypothetical protein